MESVDLAAANPQGLALALAAWAEVALIPLDGPVATDGLVPPLSPGSADYVRALQAIGRTLVEASPSDDRFSLLRTSPAGPIVAFNPALDAFVSLQRGPSISDIAAVQERYGANMATRSGNDVYRFIPSDPQITTIWDAGGIDTLDLSAFVRGCRVFLDPGRYSTLAFDGGPLLAGLGIARGCEIENAIGGVGDDALRGSSGDNRLEGRSGADRLWGGAGNDVLVGGKGRDVLSGGEGADTFVFSGGDFSSGAGSGLDTIADFARGQGDHIDVSRVDADRTRPGDQDFVWIGTLKFTGHAGELRFAPAAAGLLVSGDTDGDGSADFAFRVIGVTALETSDFLL